MSELINTHDNRATIRWKLFAGASVLVLSASLANAAQAADSDRPLIWIEIDGQFAHQQNSEALFAPAFLAASPFDGISQLDLEKGAPTIWDKGAKIIFQPAGSDWVFSLAGRYGKIGRSEVRDSHPTTAGMTKYSGKRYTAYQNFSAQSDESHTILDFQAGKDVGLGRFGREGSSVLSAGVRIAQFNSRNHVAIKSQPTNVPSYYHYNKFYASFAAKRKFTGIGPSLSWNASANLIGNSSAGSIAFDWGVNGAVLFGRQRMSAHQQTSENHWYHIHEIPGYQTSGSVARSKNVTVPNLGGFAGVSWRYSDAKISFGYRADFFFGAIDGGIEARKTSGRGFMGPFASLSVGLGD